MQAHGVIIDLQVLRAWARYHATVPAAAVCAGGTTLMILGTGHVLVDIAGIRLLSPLPIPLMAAIMLGFGLSMASQPDAVLGLPDPWRVKAARAVWAISSSIGGTVLIAALDLHVGSGPTPTALIRNLLVGNGLGLLAVAAGLGVLGWLPPLLLFLTAILFGTYASAQTYNWAFVLRPATTASELATTATIFLVGITAVALRPPVPRLTDRRI